MINELACFPTISDNVYFANNEQISIAVFTAVFFFTHTFGQFGQMVECSFKN